MSWLTTYFEPHEAQAVADFLMEVVGLEAEIKATLCHFYARPDRREDFSKQFVEGMQLGRAVEHVRPVLDHFGLGTERAGLEEIVKARNLVVHHAPEPGYYEDPEDETTGIVVWERKQGDLVRIADIEQHTADAMRLRILVRDLRTRSPTVPTSAP